MELTIPGVSLDQISGANEAASMADPSAVEDMKNSPPPYNSQKVIGFITSNPREVSKTVNELLKALA